ncbi:hypothetical protein Q7P37_009049 [Cladosporium fusiforme]
MNLEERALAQFDSLVEQGEILWQESAPRLVHLEPFDFEFHVAHSLNKKPVTAGSKKRTPAFMDKNEDFDLCSLGPRHKLILNKYCVVRPQMVLHTVEFESQDELLSVDDFHAAWLALSSMGDRYMVIFNGGKDAGASLNHKHLQVLPRPSSAGLGTLLEVSNGENSYLSKLKDVPYRLATRKLPLHPTGVVLQETFHSLRRDLGLEPGSPYNMIIVSQRMIVIPRRTADIEGVQANAAGMIGVVYCSSEEQYQAWLQRGPMQLLQKFGVPKDQ